MSHSFKVSRVYLLRRTVHFDEVTCTCLYLLDSKWTELHLPQCIIVCVYEMYYIVLIRYNLHCLNLNICTQAIQTHQILNVIITKVFYFDCCSIILFSTVETRTQLGSQPWGCFSRQRRWTAILGRGWTKYCDQFSVQTCIVVRQSIDSDELFPYILLN